MKKDELRVLINKELLELSADLKIDQSSIDEEWKKFPLIFFKWSQRYIECKYASNEALKQLDSIVAFLSHDVRSNRNKYKLTYGPTETAVKNIVVLDKKYSEAKLNYDNIMFRAELLTSALRALEHKKSTLENVSHLTVDNKS